MLKNRGIMQDFERLIKNRKSLDGFFRNRDASASDAEFSDGTVLLIVASVVTTVGALLFVDTGNDNTRCANSVRKGDVSEVSISKVRIVEKSPEKVLRTYKFDNAEVTAPWLWLLTIARLEGWKGKLDSPIKGLRSYDMQKRLWLRSKRGNGPATFNPDGNSSHRARHMTLNIQPGKEWDMAIDTTDVAELIRIARSFGVELYIPYEKELRHVETRKPFTYPDEWSPLGAVTAYKKRSSISE